MSEVYKCMTCGFTSELPGEHCGQPMTKQVTPSVPTATPSAPGATEAPAMEDNSAPASTSTDASAEEKQQPTQ